MFMHPGNLRPEPKTGSCEVAAFCGLCALVCSTLKDYGNLFIATSPGDEIPEGRLLGKNPGMLWALSWDVSESAGD